MPRKPVSTQVESPSSRPPTMHWRRNNQVWDDNKGWMPAPPTQVAVTKPPVDPTVSDRKDKASEAVTVMTSSSVRTKRAEFSERQKCAIFVRDRATCCYTADNLWHLDDGLAGLFRVHK
jgi:hypothetical protein